ncbi:hypothetical protein AYI68_g394 [Smittium mucronatum]|uniref:Uncharacterized protein n=1 Tax=Smittium mucronatum TaxID=133383 RepID=A0A1R0H8H0_9FUNG|nr:hypothetical protein AYI68_g394 [Smittium mucronatum]
MKERESNSRRKDHGEDRCKCRPNMLSKNQVSSTCRNKGTKMTKFIGSSLFLKKKMKTGPVENNPQMGVYFDINGNYRMSLGSLLFPARMSIYNRQEGYPKFRRNIPKKSKRQRLMNIFKMLRNSSNADKKGCKMAVDGSFYKTKSKRPSVGTVLGTSSGQQFKRRFDQEKSSLKRISVMSKPAKSRFDRIVGSNIFLMAKKTIKGGARYTSLIPPKYPNIQHSMMSKRSVSLINKAFMGGVKRGSIISLKRNTSLQYYKIAEKAMEKNGNEMIYSLGHNQYWFKGGDEAKMKNETIYGVRTPKLSSSGDLYEIKKPKKSPVRTKANRANRIQGCTKKKKDEIDIINETITKYKQSKHAFAPNSAMERPIKTRPKKNGIRDHINNNKTVDISTFTKVNRFLSMETTESNTLINIEPPNILTNSVLNMLGPNSKLSFLPRIGLAINRNCGAIKSTFIDTDTMSCKQAKCSDSIILSPKRSKGHPLCSKSDPIIKTNIFVIKANPNRDSSNVAELKDSLKILPCLKEASSNTSKNSSAEKSLDPNATMPINELSSSESGPKSKNNAKKTLINTKRLEMMRTAINNRKSTASVLKSIKYERFSQLNHNAFYSTSSVAISDCRTSKYVKNISEDQRASQTNLETSNSNKNYTESGDSLSTLRPSLQTSKHTLVTKSDPITAKGSIQPVDWVPKKKQNSSSLKEDLLLNVELYKMMVDY